MAKRLKKMAKDPASPRRSREKMRRHIRQFNKIVLAYIVLVVLAAIAASNSRFDMASPSSGGFAYNFLLLPAALPGIIVNLASSLFGCSITVTPGYEAWYFCACDLFMIVNLWWIMRLIAFKRQSAAVLRTAKVFIMIIVCWGIFQLTCGAFHWAWKKYPANISCSQNPSGAMADRQ